MVKIPLTAFGLILCLAFCSAVHCQGHAAGDAIGSIEVSLPRDILLGCEVMIVDESDGQTRAVSNEMKSVELHDAQYLSVGYATNLSDEELEAVCKIPRLRSLDLAGNSKITIEAAQCLRQSELLADLDLTGTQVSDEWMASIAAMPSLRRLTIRHRTGQVTSAGVTELRSAAKLTSINFSGNRVLDDESTAALATLSGLLELDVSEWAITDKGLRDIGKLVELRTLRVCSCSHVTGLGAKALASLTKLEKLTWLETELDDETLETLCMVLPLKVLALAEGQNSLGESTLCKIARLTGLQRLDLECDETSDKVLARLARSLCLRSVKLRSCRKVTILGVEQLANSLQIKLIVLDSMEQIPLKAVLEVSRTKPGLISIVLADAVPAK